MNSSDDEPISEVIAKRKGKVSKKNDSGSETDEEDVVFVAKKGKKDSRDDRSLSSMDSDSDSSSDEDDDQGRQRDSKGNDVPGEQQSPSGSEYSPSGDRNDEDEVTQHDRGRGNEGSMFARIVPIMGNNTDKYSVKHARSILRVNSVGNSNMVFQYVAKTVFPDMKFTEGDEELERELLEIALIESSVVIGDSRIPEAAFTQEYYPVVSKSITKLRERTICSIRNKFLRKLIVDLWKFSINPDNIVLFPLFQGTTRKTLTIKIRRILRRRFCRKI